MLSNYTGANYLSYTPIDDILYNMLTCQTAYQISYMEKHQIEVEQWEICISYFTIVHVGTFYYSSWFFLSNISRYIWEMFPRSWWDKVYTNVEWWIMHERTAGVKSDIFQPQSGSNNLNKDYFYQSKPSLAN